MRLLASYALVLALAASGCRGSSSAPDKVWGQRGVMPGDFVRPRAAAILGDRLYVVDFTARVQAFDLDGKHLGIVWTTPDFRNGRPSGLGVGRDGNLLVCDSHYHTLRVYSPEGTELRTFGGKAGSGPGEFGYLSDAVQDADGCYYVSEFGANEPHHQARR